MRVAIGSDHAGFALKEAVKTVLVAEHHDVVDVGTHSDDPVDYPDQRRAATPDRRRRRTRPSSGAGGAKKENEHVGRLVVLMVGSAWALTLVSAGVRNEVL